VNFKNKLENAVEENNSLLCIGLDPDTKLIGDKSLFDFNREIIDETHKLVCSYKPQIAYYSARGPKGLEELIKTVTYIKKNLKTIPVILDSKRADIGSTNEKYAQEAFEVIGADALTVNPYLGFDSLEPFFKREDKGIIILCKTSNPGSSALQDLKVDSEPVFIKVAKKVVVADKKYKNLLMVVGATYPDHLKKIRQVAKEMTFLIPGVGTQGGDLKKTLENGLMENGRGLIISASRSIIYAQDPKKSAKKLRDEINEFR